MCVISSRSASKSGAGEPKLNALLVATRNAAASDFHLSVGLPPMLRIAADLVKDLTLTGYPGIKEEMEQAVANFVDQPVVADRNVVSSRLPEDIPVFNEKVKELLSGKAKSSAA